MLCAGIPPAPICFLSHSDIVWAVPVCSRLSQASLGILPTTSAFGLSTSPGFIWSIPSIRPVAYATPAPNEF